MWTAVHINSNIFYKKTEKVICVKDANKEPHTIIILKSCYLWQIYNIL